MARIRRVSFRRDMRIVNARRGTTCGVLAGAFAAGGLMLTVEARQRPAAPPLPAATPRSVINRYCVSCHSEHLKTGGLSLEKAAASDVDQNSDVWEKVLRKIRARQMPPIGLARPDEGTYEAAISSLESSLDRAAAAAPNPG